MTQTYKWEGAGTPLPDGHRIFETHDHPDGARWAIADESGDTPDQTDDGILWLDHARCLRVGDGVPSIPLYDEDGAKSSSLTDCATVLYLSRLLGWTIEDATRGRFYNAR